MGSTGPVTGQPPAYGTTQAPDHGDILNSDGFTTPCSEL